MGSDMSMNGKRAWFVTGVSPSRALEIARGMLQHGYFALLLVRCLWTSFRQSLSEYKRIGRVPGWIAGASWRGASSLSFMATHLMTVSMVVAALLMILAFLMRSIAMALVRVVGD